MFCQNPKSKPVGHAGSGPGQGREKCKHHRDSRLRALFKHFILHISTYFYIIVFFQKQKTKTQACKTSQILSKNEAPDPSWEPRIEASLHFWAALEAAFSFGAFARSSEGSKGAKGAYEWVIRDRGGCWLDKRVSEEAGGSMRTTTTTTMTTTTRKIWSCTREHCRLCEAQEYGSVTSSQTIDSCQ